MPKKKTSPSDLERAFNADRSSENACLKYMTALSRSIDGPASTSISKAILKVLESYPVNHQTHLIDGLVQLMKNPNQLFTDADHAQLAQNITKDHHDAAEAALNKWLEGSQVLEYKKSTPLSDSDQNEIKELWKKTVIESYSYKRAVGSDHKESHCRLLINELPFEIDYENSYYREIDSITIYGPEKLALIAAYDNNCKLENWLTATTLVQTKLDPALFLCFIYLVGFDLLNADAPYAFHFEEVLESLEEMVQAPRDRANHEAAVKLAIEEWIAGDCASIWANKALALSEKDKKEVTRLLESTSIQSFRFDNFQVTAAYSRCEFSIGSWRGEARWRSRFKPRVREVTWFKFKEDECLPFDQEQLANEWKAAAEMAKSKLSLEQFIYFAHIVAFDLSRKDLRSHRPQWRRDFKAHLAAIKGK